MKITRYAKWLDLLGGHLAIWQLVNASEIKDALVPLRYQEPTSHNRHIHNAPPDRYSHHVVLRGQHAYYSCE